MLMGTPCWRSWFWRGNTFIRWWNSSNDTFACLQTFLRLRTTRNVLDCTRNTSHATGYYQLPLNNISSLSFLFSVVSILFNMIDCSSVGLSLFFFQMVSDSKLLHICVDRFQINIMKWMNLSIHQSGHSVLICKHTVI